MYVTSGLSCGLKASPAGYRTTLGFWILGFRMRLLMNGDLQLFVFALMKNDDNGTLMSCEEF
jgi:hypothetical protein